ncbi:MAG: aminopeptidase N [Dehalococcoidia bacterium]
MTVATPPRDLLTQADAEARAARISNCSYVLAIDLRKGSPAYTGRVTIRFAASGSGDTFLCHRGKEIRSMVVNGAAVPSPAWDGYHLTIPGALLRAQNTVEIDYLNEYDHGGDGFHQFVDPEDGEEYLYSNFEPYEAHRLFPCFDQPDIKATYDLTVTAPAEWEVIHNVAAASIEAASDGRRVHRFKQTPKLSTYLFALIAGPYASFHDKHGEIDLGVYCRKSIAKHYDGDEFFMLTKQGLDFYADFFGIAYPFGKYDQLFVPEFNPGAMENAGAVTFHEKFIFRDPPTDTDRRGRAEVVLHEMAHMWFGDLVTMKWWDDLWLNESFATYMSYLCMAAATRFGESGWQDFNASIKQWAYRTDQLVTTHPIAGTVEDTEQTFLNFDGITYGKGASVLKQLVAAIGYEGFREGMRHYFRTHAYGNTTLAQFLAALETGSGRDLKAWAKLWLETESVNTIAAEVEADGDRVASLRLTQAAPVDYPTIRPHTLEVGLVNESAGGLEIQSVRAAIDGTAADVPAAVGLKRPDLVFPNHNDHGYFKVALDEASVAFAKDNLHRIDDALFRQLLWSSLWAMTRDAQLKAQEFLAVVRESVPREPEIALVEVALGHAQTVLARFIPDEWRPEHAALLAKMAFDGLKAAPQGDPKITWMRALVGFAHSDQDLALLGRLADGTEVVPGLTVDQEMRWAIAAKQVAAGIPGAAGRVAAEAERDPSDRGQRARLRCETSTPDAAVKAAAWGRFTGEGYGSLQLTQAAMSGFLWARQKALLAPYVDRYFADVAEVVRAGDREFYTGYAKGLFPAYLAEQRVLDQSAELAERVAEELPNLTRMLREANDDLARVIRCQAFARS